MKNYIIAAVVIIFIIGGIVWVRGNNVTPLITDDASVINTTPAVEVEADIMATTSPEASPVIEAE